ncbi:type II toxin-antitoxin system RelE family toxin [Pseudonocardia sp. D17]|uniref:type II toxin-antitoxin system RelE family toxin n=1 Tax=Pseudonocardia sp. D17 TaxID=882661 RepID=UPI002B3BEE96|nr:translation repressor RelE [Pseudonocardia sp. D17]
MPERYSIEVRPAAQKMLRKLDPPVSRRVLLAIQRLADDPRPAGVKALVGAPGLLRLRVGDYRVVYTVEDGRLLVVVVHLAHRREVYRGGSW